VQNLPLPEGVLSVHELISQIRASLERTFPSQWVTGEISNLRTPRSGHTYFTLKDAEAQIQAVFFRHKKRYIRFEPEDGMQVLCKGKVTLYEVRGDLQITIDYMEPLGIGALHLAFEQIKTRLEAEGLFDVEHKQPLPLLPQRIGVITSPTGAAIRDILQIIQRRFADVEILIAPVHVQGERAAPEIVAAIESLNRWGNLDVLILARGGGSIEDLWPFNEEIVARAIHASCLPIVSAVGHETDFTIADFAADVRAPTPSAAAELVVRNKVALQEKIDQIDRRLRLGVSHFLERLWAEVEIHARRIVTPEQRISMYQQRLDELSEAAAGALRQRIDLLRERLKGYDAAMCHLSPRARIAGGRDFLETLNQKLIREQKHFLQSRQERLDALSGRLAALSPLNVLARGYSIVTRLPEGSVVRDAMELSLRDRLGIRLYRGKVECIVDRIEEG
jgi:exodeoxyribonuclease VII large subunit